MNSITIITIVVVALLTAVVFGLMWLGYSSCLRAYRLEVENGKHDDAIVGEYRAAKKSKGGLVGIIGSYLTLFTLLGLFITGLVYKASGENFHINNSTVLVIKSGSMSSYYDDATAAKYEELGYDSNLQFSVGDICTFELAAADAPLVVGEVYGYKHKDIIITHRLIRYADDTCYFRGDNNPVADAPIARDKIIYHYTGHKVPGLGAFILYAQSYFGIWSLTGLMGVAISSEIVYHKVRVINRKRLEKVEVDNEM